MEAKLDELMALVGSDLGTTGWETITQAEVLTFGQVTRAREWIHTDVARTAAESPYGVPVVHGYFVLSLATHFVTQLLPSDVSATGINAGVDRVRFTRPVPVGARVRARGRLVSAESRGRNLRTVVELAYETDGASEPVCVAEIVSLLVPSEANERT